MASRDCAFHKKNKTETCAFPNDDGRAGGCGAPALPGSPYCRRHRRLCSLPPGSEAAIRELRALERDAAGAAEVPPDLAYLASVAAPELDAADEPRDIAGCLDVIHDRETCDE